MAIILIACTLVTAISAAPAISHGVDSDWQKELVNGLGLQSLQELYRGKRSGYGNVYMSPCAAAAASSSIPGYASSPIPAYAQATASAAPVPTYTSPSAGMYHYGQPTYQPAHTSHYYRHPYYRSAEEVDEHETLGFSDMNTLDHMPTARFSYDAPSAAGGTGGASQPSGPMVGIFSNANVGGCSVPLLVSCSPSIAQGRIAKAHPYYGGSQPSSQGNAYRVVDEHPLHVGIERHQELSTSSEHPTEETKPSDSKHQ